MTDFLKARNIMEKEQNQIIEASGKLIETAKKQAKKLGIDTEKLISEHTNDYTLVQALKDRNIDCEVNKEPTSYKTEKRLILMFDGETTHKFTVKKFDPKTDDKNEYKIKLIDKLLSMDFSKTKSEYVTFIDGRVRKFPTDKTKLKVLQEHYIDEIFNTHKIKPLIKKEQVDLELKRTLERKDIKNTIEKIKIDGREKAKLFKKKFDIVCDILDGKKKLKGKYVIFTHKKEKHKIPTDRTKLISLWYQMLLEKSCLIEVSTFSFSYVLYIHLE